MNPDLTEPQRTFQHAPPSICSIPAAPLPHPAATAGIVDWLNATPATLRRVNPYSSRAAPGGPAAASQYPLGRRQSLWLKARVTQLTNRPVHII